MSLLGPLRVPLAVGAIALFGVGAFLAGRRSALPSAPVRPTPSTPVTAAPLRRATPPSAPSPSVLPLGVAATTAPETPSPEPILSDPREVARYLQLVAAIERSAHAWGDPEVFARMILNEAPALDPHALDGHIVSNENAVDALRRLKVPAACGAHQARLVAVMEEATILLKAARDLRGADHSEIEAVQASHANFEGRLRAVNASDAEIRDRYGLVR